MILLLLMLAGMVLLVYFLLKAAVNEAPNAVLILIVVLMACLGYPLYQNFDNLVALWTDITTWSATAIAYVAASWNDFLDGMATAWNWIGLGLVVAIGIALALSIIWPVAKRLARIEVNEAKEKTAAAERQAEEERQKRVDAEQRADAAEAVARRSVADKAEAERLYAGLIGQLHQAVSLADRRGKQLREGREKKRVEKGVLPVRQIEKAVEPTNGQSKEPRDTRKRRKPGKGRSPKRLPSRLPRR